MLRMSLKSKFGLICLKTKFTGDVFCDADDRIAMLAQL